MCNATNKQHIRSLQHVDEAAPTRSMIIVVDWISSAKDLYSDSDMMKI